MKAQMMRHIQAVSNMTAANLPLNFVCIWGLEDCEKASTEILEQGISELVGKLSAETRKYFLKDPKVSSCISKMISEGAEVPLWRLERLFHQAKEEKLSAFSAKEIQAVLLDEEIPSAVQFLYMKYFRNIEQTPEEHLQVLASLEKYVKNSILDIADLSEAERRILFEPLYTTCLLDGLLEERETWQVLLQPDVMELLKEISWHAYNFQTLSRSTFLQLTENPKEIHVQLNNVLKQFKEEQYPDLLQMWLQNDTLRSDLKRLERVLPVLDEEKKAEILESRVAYVCTLYQTNLDQIDMTALPVRKEEVLLYAILTGKKHFLKLVNENSEDFMSLSDKSFILDPYIYQNYLNLNTLNEKNLRDAFHLKTISPKNRAYLNRKSYTYEELQLLAPLDSVYYQLYGYLANDRSDERLRITRELIKKDVISTWMKEEELQRLAETLSRKPLSGWMQEEFRNIRDLNEVWAVQLLTDWEAYQRFIPGMENERQVICLIRNKRMLEKYDTFAAFRESLLKNDEAWLWLKEKLSITDAFIEQHEPRIRSFIFRGEAELVYQFCISKEHQLEDVRRLVQAELMGEFENLKYYEADLEMEIAYPISGETELMWKENMVRTTDGCRLWEEDRFIPVLQIGEVPTHTCISYRDGYNNDCLLSCFDANKKVLYLEMDGKIVFRALIRLTKGAKSAAPIRKRRVEFADLTKEGGKERDREELVLFLERPYFSGINKEQENKVIALVYQLVREKAKKLNAKVVISQSYERYEASKDYKRTNYYVYISASKNGKQYLDSLGGEATVSQSGTYESNIFLLEEVTNGRKVA